MTFALRIPTMKLNIVRFSHYDDISCVVLFTTFNKQLRDSNMFLKLCHNRASAWCISHKMQHGEKNWYFKQQKRAYGRPLARVW